VHCCGPESPRAGADYFVRALHQQLLMIGHVLASELESARAGDTGPWSSSCTCGAFRRNC
jgi:hypothetical protein